MVEVVNIPKEYECLLAFVYPTYSIYLDESPCVTSHFVTHRIVTSKPERELLSIQYSNCVFISNQIFDVLLDEEELAKRIVKTAHSLFKDRRTKFVKATKDITGVATWSKETFVDDCLHYLFGLPTESEDTQILELFECYGSKSFASKFLALASSRPWQSLFASMLTFISKVQPDSPSLYYKKRYMQYGKRIQQNKFTALSDYALRPGGELSALKLLLDLVV